MRQWGSTVTSSADKIGLAYAFDDDRAVGLLACQFLEAIGYETRHFATSAPFMAAITSSPPDVILLDLALGQTDAIEVMRQLSAQQFTGAILLMSAREPGLLADVHGIGTSYGLQLLTPLQKPFRLAALR